MVSLLTKEESGFRGRELLTGLTQHALHLLLHAAIGPDAETDGVLGHP
jgi:hypothetical protein